MAKYTYKNIQNLATNFFDGMKMRKNIRTLEKQNFKKKQKKL